MAFRHLGESPMRALPGQILLVVHDFEARSPDELNLCKGDRIELIERDDDFGDGWYLGKHAQSSNIGLFPEVYTTTAPRGNTISAAVSAFNPRTLPQISTNQYQTTSFNYNEQNFVSPVSQGDETPQASRHATATDYIGTSEATPRPLNTTPPLQRNVSMPISSNFSQTSTAPSPAQRSISMITGNNRGHGDDSPVMNETLSVIDEHITDMKTPRSSLATGKRREANDSGSEYSSHMDYRLSYIAGTETDEEESNAHTEEEVLAWPPAKVAEYLKSVGVESQHCEVFKEQEISGEVLLRMDQASLFIKEFDLGLVGRRLRTWYKIKALQDEVGIQNHQGQKSSYYVGGDASSEDSGRNKAQSKTASSMLPRTPNLMDRPESSQKIHQQRDDMRTPPLQSQQQLRPLRNDANRSPLSFAFASVPDSPGRPSAASIRELNHSRHHSLIDLTSGAISDNPIERTATASPGKATAFSHKKQHSFDRNWTMGGAIQTSSANVNSTIGRGLHTVSLSCDRNTFDPNLREPMNMIHDIDRGYVSGGEIDSKRSRILLKKRDAVSANHSRRNSYLDEQRRKGITTPKRHSRFGSADSIRDTVAAITGPASQMYHNSTFKGRFRKSSVNDTSPQPDLSKDISSPTVTKLEYDGDSRQSIIALSPKPDNQTSLSVPGSPISQMQSPTSVAKPRVGLRAISDAVTGSEKALVGSPASVPSAAKESPLQSPTRTGSTTPSGASKSFDLDSTDVSTKGTHAPTVVLAPTSGTTRRKSKKETSAYTRGLERKSPQEQMVSCDYSGWMKKKSSNLMTTWKPRLFVLRGRRLSYYYSDTDTQEKGLIDISSHRVLPADHDFLTGLHATVTGAKASPTSPSNAQTPTIASAEAAAQPESTLQKPGADTMFIFKLVPPRSGLSRAVNFTKPTVHYFAIDNIKQGRLWMAALMKATIDRDETKPVTSTYQQKTISLAKAKAMRHRPPALMGLDERIEGVRDSLMSDDTGLNILGLDFMKGGLLVGEQTATSLDAVPTLMPSEHEAREERNRDLE
ncbi:Sterile alpha motif/pointed domain [Lasallia pustulata]|uniref:Sterile alpha motif/pointed domain n=1 Tax=Lasallia pustulata TaxID=136370 RepID=A0A1W5D1R0_9LECA|nr:Sterile alpha motif/pointed domain [Lasallia pustulata]